MINLLKVKINALPPSKSIIVCKGFDCKSVQELQRITKSDEKSIIENDKVLIEKLNGSFLMDYFMWLTNAQKERIVIPYELLIKLTHDFKFFIDENIDRIVVLENIIFSWVKNQTNFKTEDLEERTDLLKEIQGTSDLALYYSYSRSVSNEVVLYYRPLNDDLENAIETVSAFENVRPLASSEENMEVKRIANTTDYDQLLIEVFYNSNLTENVCVDQKLINSDLPLKNSFGLLNSYLHSAFSKEILIQTQSTRNTQCRPEINNILKDIWGYNSFRNIQVYKAPEQSKDITEISQGVIIETVVNQFELKLNGEAGGDVFITAPTGSGKSLLFQIPAIYLAKHYNAVTIVISPLIALMEDQVKRLVEEGYSDVAFINSSVSLFERERILAEVKSGDKSVLYMAPELLLSYQLQHFIGDRDLGLLVVDEAHTVTTWGRDFRVDYWYLGTFIRNIRKYNNSPFVTMALTATAVYQPGGLNDMVGETLSSLGMRCDDELIFIGNIKRNDINFNINSHTFEGTHEKKRIELTAQKLTHCVQNGLKTLVYCPYTEHAEKIKDQLPAEIKYKVGVYFSRLDKEEKDRSYIDFKSGKITAIICTKAFGMGVDIDDIEVVYHHAPSGHLSDYVQEVGRLARKSGLQGNAIVDFEARDLKYTKTLYGLSSIKHFQVKMVLKKIYDLYLTGGKKQQMLINTSNFSHIFSNRDNVEAKTKNVLLLLEKDLEKTYGFPIIKARPKSLFSKVYLGVSNSEEENFRRLYNRHITSIKDERREKKGEVIFEMDLGKVWNDVFSKISFPKAKYLFYTKQLFDGFAVNPLLKLSITIEDKATITKKMEIACKLIDNILWQLKNKSIYEKAYLTEAQIEKAFSKALNNDSNTAKRITQFIISSYTTNTQDKHRNKNTFMQPKKQTYKVTDEFAGIGKAIMYQLRNKLWGLFKDNELSIYLNTSRPDKYIETLRTAYLIEALNLGTYETNGGKDPMVYLFVTSPKKIRYLSSYSSNYENEILNGIRERYELSVRLMEYFFTTELTTAKRWEFIEDYFLGVEESQLLKIKN